MKIQTQNAITIIPVFLVLAIISSGLLFVTERQEIYWGLNEEASSLAISIAEFINGKGLDHIATKESSFKTIIDWEQAKSIRIFSYQLDDLSLFAEYGDKSYGDRNSNIITYHYFNSEENIIEDIIKKGLIVTDLLVLPSAKHVMCAYVPIYSNAKKVCGILEVTIDAQEIKTRTQELLVSSLKMTIGILLFGFVVVLIISKQITSSILLLNRAASIISSGNYEYKISEKGTINIQEVNDLSNTFNTMSSVLREFSSQSKQELIEAEQFRTSDDLAKNYLEKYFQPINETIGGYKALIYRVGDNVTSDFFDRFTYDTSYYVVVGKINSGASLQDLTIASSILTLIKEKLMINSPKETLEKITKLFEIEFCYILQWNEQSRSIQVFKYRDKTIDSYPFDPDKKNPLIISTTGKEIEEKFRLYVNRFHYIDDDELVKELFFLVEDGDDGIISIIR